MQHIPKLTTATELNYNLLADKTNELIDQIDFYKSIVKAVDPDNLPEDREVLAINKGRDFLFGHLCSGKSVCENKYFFWCESLGDAVYEVTHYIEKKDIIKMMGDL